MSSPLVLRYADLSKKPLSEVEDFWRAAKRKANDDNRKGHWPTVMGFFKESLGLSDKDGRLCYFHDSQAEILAETPAFALIRILHPDTVEDESVRAIVEQSKGLITVNYEHLFNQPNKAPIGYPYQREELKEDTTSIGIGTGNVGGLGIVGVWVPGSKVKHKGRSAMVCYSTKDETRIQYLNDKGFLMGEEAAVPHSELSIGKSSIYEQAERIWLGMSESLTPDQRIVGFREILKYEHHLGHVPETLVEAVVKAFSSTPDQKKERGTLELTDADWQIVFNKDEESKEGNAARKNPLPVKPPENPVKKPEQKPSAAPAPSTSTSKSSDVREPSDSEIRSMISKVKESRTTINLKSLADEAERATASKLLKNKGINALVSREQRLAESANRWDSILGNK